MTFVLPLYCTKWSGPFGGSKWKLMSLHMYADTWPMSPMGVQGLFNTHSLAFTYTHKHSGGVQYSLTGIQPVQTIEGPIDMFSNMRSTLRPYKFGLNFRCMPFLWLRQTRRCDVTLEYIIGRRSWCPLVRLATKNTKVVQKLRKLDISQLLFN